MDTSYIVADSSDPASVPTKQISTENNFLYDSKCVAACQEGRIIEFSKAEAVHSNAEEVAANLDTQVHSAD